MQPKTLADWLRWQESLNPAEMKLGLERVREVADRLDISQPAGKVAVIAGTNGKGSCAAIMDTLFRAAGEHAGCYTSPHLVRYNERFAVGGVPASDAEIVAAFSAIEAIRGDVPLTFFEYGTLAALQVFSQAGCTAWTLEVGLGGRLDAVNVVTPDVSVITTVDLDHQVWLGETIEAIAAEKAGILRPGKPGFYGDRAPPESLRRIATEMKAPLAWPWHGYSWSAPPDADTWCWQGKTVQLDALPRPVGCVEVQLRNWAVALAAMEALDPALLAAHDDIRQALSGLVLPGRFQWHRDTHSWILDVAHNPQAARALKAQLTQLEPAPTTVVAGMLGDKRATEFAAALDLPEARWIVCPTQGNRGAPAEQLANYFAQALVHPPEVASSVPAALLRARDITPIDGRIIVCGSFQVVGPALEWLGLY